MSRSRSSASDARDAKEYDSTERSAEVYLFTRPVDQSLPDSIEYLHWALVFIFQGDDVRTAEGYPDSSERLYPKYTKLFPVENGKYYTLCTAKLSPAELLKAVVDNRCNNEKYCATWENCQVWLKALASHLGGDVAKKMNEYKTLREANPLVAVAGKKKLSSGFGSFSRS